MTEQATEEANTSVETRLVVFGPASEFCGVDIGDAVTGALATVQVAGEEVVVASSGGARGT